MQWEPEYPIMSDDMVEDEYEIDPDDARDEQLFDEIREDLEL